MRGKDGLVHVFTTMYNQEAYVQEFVDWYRKRLPNCLITIHNNMSTDNSKQIALDNYCNVIDFETGGKMDEGTLIKLRNTAWVGSNTHFAIVIDFDEFLTVEEKDLIDCLDNNSWTVCKCN